MQSNTKERLHLPISSDTPRACPRSLLQVAARHLHKQRFRSAVGSTRRECRYGRQCLEPKTGSYIHLHVGCAGHIPFQLQTSPKGKSYQILPDITHKFVAGLGTFSFELGLCFKLLLLSFQQISFPVMNQRWTNRSGLRKAPVALDFKLTCQPRTDRLCTPN